MQGFTSEFGAECSLRPFMSLPPSLQPWMKVEKASRPVLARAPPPLALITASTQQSTIKGRINQKLFIKPSVSIVKILKKLTKTTTNKNILNIITKTYFFNYWKTN